ncbi:Predicted kinase, aminoglycoside phosphotransferase (APT) family [Saccharopolyspora antimicrobica]|uniref:Aminoglycoside phosphotransferase (APT) family kinase protein n=1 Tax=Saccharopolyspora antimicrobica TaxID=455193 RepID=A0A1I4W2K1_9PSEU|nr:aminoglycoside phosphotransferase family protein [Saccharopolyspora antimicrobica]RKT87096.1 aminoglycoside phosphotransferase (APT) family kinase protein [Saccharopolyspora antimicrobica]SFN07741.1 Predicted kinase, aminoglycoside phosphotransferase (APT) family [Saccharopolyspora antimicrobica]
MINRHKRQLACIELNDVLKTSGINPGLVRSCEELPEGTFNTVYRIRLTDGTCLVLKVAPNPDAPILTYEHGIMATEELFYTLAVGTGRVPTPRVAHADYRRAVIGNDFLVMTECPGQSWFDQRDLIGDNDGARLRVDLGRMVAALHQVTGPGFGYPQEAVAPLAQSWRTAFLAMTGAVLGDVLRYDVTLPRPTSEINALVLANAAVLDEVTKPAMVHFDLWLGNILVDCHERSSRIGGLIDGERAFWGDPVADFVSLALFGDLTKDDSFLAGYRAAGGRVTFNAATRLRLALYRTYLYLIMLVESVLRSCSRLEHRQMTAFVSRHLVSELAVLAGAAR